MTSGSGSFLSVALKSRHDILQAEGVYATSPAMSTGKRGALVSHMDDVFGGELGRKYVLAWLFGYSMRPMSSSFLTDAQCHALYWWLSPYNEEGQWLIEESKRSKAACMLAVALTQASRAGEVLPSVLEQIVVAVALGGELTDANV